MVGPFVLFDHFGPVMLAPGEGVEIAPHGHAHLATVTYFFSGASHHTDSLGNDVVVEPGAVAWMHAGAGIVHAERTPDAWRGGEGHGIQAWTALPEALEESAPRFQLAPADAIPVVTRGEVSLRILVGEAFGVRSPIETSSPILLVEARTGARAGELTLEQSAAEEKHAVFFVEGFGALEGHRVGVGTLLSLRDGAPARLRLEADTRVLFFGGRSLGRRLMQGNVIASSAARLEEALVRLDRR